MGEQQKPIFCNQSFSLSTWYCSATVLVRYWRHGLHPVCCFAVYLHFIIFRWGCFLFLLFLFPFFCPFMIADVFGSLSDPYQSVKWVVCINNGYILLGAFLILLKAQFCPEIDKNSLVKPLKLLSMYVMLCCVIYF